MMKKIIAYTLALLFGLSSCGDFLEESSQNLSYVNSLQDLDELLIGNGYYQYTSGSNYYFFWLEVMDDDLIHHLYKTPGTSSSAGYLLEFYKWSAYPFDDDYPTRMGGNILWKQLYSKIGIANTVIEEAKRFREEDETHYRKVIGEAQFLRSFYYFYLVNLWGHPYSAETATAPGVPVKTTDYIEDRGFPRNTVQECYDQIVEDAGKAVQNLKGIEQPTVMRASENAARMLLAKAYLFMNKYQLALNQCDSILDNAAGLALLDMNHLSKKEFIGLKRLRTSGEVIFMNGFCPSQLLQNSAEGFVTSSDLLSLYGEGDRRFVAGDSSHFYRHTKGTYQTWKRVAGSPVASTGLTLPDLYLIKAEAEALLGKTTDANASIQALRTKRIKNPSDLNLSGEALVNFIRDERRRELCFEGQRWFDLRRYAVHPQYPKKTRIEHPFYEWTTSMVLQKTYVLEEYPGDGGWLLPFPVYAMESNPELEQNIRPERD